MGGGDIAGGLRAQVAALVERRVVRSGLQVGSWWWRGRRVGVRGASGSFWSLDRAESRSDRRIEVGSVIVVEAQAVKVRELWSGGGHGSHDRQRHEQSKRKYLVKTLVDQEEKSHKRSDWREDVSVGVRSGMRSTA